jgi:D-amino-acid dehydrogenase
MRDTIVLGGGMAGVATALALQARGREVALVDRGEARARASYGNAGIIQVEAAEPYAMPRAPRELFEIALRRSNAVRWDLAGLAACAGPLWAYFRHSAPARHRRTGPVYAALTARAAEDHAPLIEAAGAGALIRREGFRQVYRDEASLAAAAAEAERLGRDYGVRSEVLDGAGLAAREPGLRGSLAGGVHWRDPWTCRDPGALVEAYTRLFRARGGHLQEADALSLARHGKGWRVGGPGAGVEGAEAVIALGMGSAALCARHGLRVPLFAKRGYHRHYAAASAPDLPFVDVASGAVLAPMAAGLRISTGAEIARPGAPPRPLQLDRAARAAAALFELGAPLDEPWSGARPCLPDMLPAVGALPGEQGLWANFGHGHQGFTLGPTTAALLAEAMTGAAPPPAALSPARFARRRG